MAQSQTGVAEVNGAALNYEIAGAGQPLVMLHGHLLDMHQWDDQFAELAATHRVLRYDARGFGDSTLPPLPFSHSDDLRALLELLGIEHAVLMGCSNGGAACVDFALQHPAMVDGLILVGSSLSGLEPEGPPPPVFQAWMEAQQRDDFEAALEYSLRAFTDGERRAPEQVDPAVRERTRQMTAKLFARPDVPGSAEQWLDPPAVGRLAELRAPTLAIVGGDDVQFIRDAAAMIAAQVPGARTVLIDDAGHHPNMEHPAQFDQIVRAFLAEIGR